MYFPQLLLPQLLAPVRVLPVEPRVALLEPLHQRARPPQLATELALVILEPLDASLLGLRNAVPIIFRDHPGGFVRQEIGVFDELLHLHEQAPVLLYAW